MNNLKIIFALCFFLALPACGEIKSAPEADKESEWFPASRTETRKTVEIDSVEIRRVIESADEQIKITGSYTQEYFVIAYPSGDVPAETGACTDVVIRAFRAAGVDLQKEVHEDMRANFAVYPKKWGLPAPDTNIDHRRVPNLQTFFTRRGKSLPITRNAKDYQPGDVVAWDINGKGMTHIGIVSNVYDKRSKRFLITHNIGGGVAREDYLFEWKIIGHYRYF